MTVPVRPFPALQCTATTLFSSASRKACMSWQTAISSGRAGALWSSNGKQTASPEPPSGLVNFVAGYCRSEHRL